MKSLRQQMTDAMVLRGFAARTQEAYLACAVALARHYRRPPDTLTTDELQAYLLHLITERKQAYASVNQACAFRFIYERVLQRPNARFDIPMAKVPKRLPQVLARAEVARLIGAARSLRGRPLLMTTYAAGLRVSELCALQVADTRVLPTGCASRYAKARATRIAIRCSHRFCSTPCATTGRSAVRGPGCFPIPPAPRRSPASPHNAYTVPRVTPPAFHFQAVCTR